MRLRNFNIYVFALSFQLPKQILELFVGPFLRLLEKFLISRNTSLKLSQPKKKNVAFFLRKIDLLSRNFAISTKFSPGRQTASFIIFKIFETLQKTIAEKYKSTLEIEKNIIITRKLAKYIKTKHVVGKKFFFSFPVTILLLATTASLKKIN